MAANGGHLAEITQRKTSCMATLGPVSTKCFNLEAIELCKTNAIAQSLVFSRLTFSAGSWHELTKGEDKAYSKAVMRIWRRTTKNTYRHAIEAHQVQMSDQQAINKHGSMAPRTITRLLRLNLLMRVAIKQNPIVVAFAFAAKGSQKSWLDAAESNFAWLRGIDRLMSTPHLTSVSSISAWFTYIRINPTWWKI